jgi:hypothetical protein
VGVGFLVGFGVGEGVGVGARVGAGVIGAAVTGALALGSVTMGNEKAGSEGTANDGSPLAPGAGVTGVLMNGVAGGAALVHAATSATNRPTLVDLMSRKSRPSVRMR